MADDPKSGSKTEADADKAATAGEPRKMRVLIAHDEHLPNHVITLDATAADAAVAAKWADDDAEAVAWAEANEPQPKAKA